MQASALADIVAEELLAVAGGSATAEEVARAKNATISGVLMNLESRAVIPTSLALGQQYLHSIVSVYVTRRR